MLFQMAFPVMMIDSCVVSSVRQPPGSHCTQYCTFHSRNTAAYQFMQMFDRTEMSYLLIAEGAQPVDRLPRISHHLPFEESNVEAGRVIVHKLKEEHLQRQAVLVLRFGPRQLCSTQNECSQ